VNISAFAGFLDALDFTHFCTFTTRLPVSVGATRRIAERVARHVDAGRSASLFWCAEKFDVRDGFHFHALLRTGAHKLDLWGWYFPRYGRCQIIDNREPDRQLKASYYCSKYITKAISDWDIYFSDDLRLRSQAAFFMKNRQRDDDFMIQYE